MNHIIVCVVFFIFANEVIYADQQFSILNASNLVNQTEKVVRNYDTSRSGDNLKINKEEIGNVSNFADGAIWKIELKQSFNLICNFSGEPQPKVLWFKYQKDEKKILQIADRDHMSFENDGKTLQFKSASEDDEGKYECEAKCGEISNHRSVTIEITKDVPWYSQKYFLFGVLILVVILLVICQARRGFSVYNKLERAGLANFVAGNVSGLNPELALDVQADLLPYDRKYEFPRNKLKLGKQLGAGAFGIVLEATAQGITANEKETRVAVKMVKKVACNDVMRALVSELKIMVHLGQHLNVVNLLGAVTKGITQFNLMVIVEYCPYGNLQSFLTKNRRYFIDQIVPGTNRINTKMDQYLSRKQATISSRYYRSNARDYSSFDMGSTSLEPMIQSQNSSSGSSCVVTINDTPPRSITTEDLFIWSFQIARGMEYLASRKVLHGDLAARNILLCEDKVVKICDFGLARSLYKNENYHMKTTHCLPLKWLALESINDQVFSTYSDVWSFGIVLWELFSLGEKPYADLKIEDLIQKLNDGYRMEKPLFATECIYRIMLSCWFCNPEKRPKFGELEKSISKILGKSLSDHYIDLNEPYIEANETRFNSDETTDYLTLLSPPESQAPPVPVNELREKYFPFLSKSSNDTLTATNGIYINSDVLK